MTRRFLFEEIRLISPTTATTGRAIGLRRVAAACTAAGILACGLAAAAQVITIDTSGKGTVARPSGPVDRRYAQITPTKVPLTKTELDAKTRLELIRVLQSEQGFAMRPFPMGHKGLTLVANGKLEPAGEAYLNMVTSAGLSAKPGDRVVLSDVKIEHNKIIFDLNGGPDAKHRFLSHVSIGQPGMEGPVVRDAGQAPAGSRLTLTFAEHIPALTGSEVKALLAPMIEFDVKSPIQAFTDTLPKPLKEAILNHHVMVGMSTDMVLFAKGQPENKTREMEGQMPFEEWIYGKPPEEVDFVRINGNRVIRLEVAKMGEKPVIFDKDEVSGMMRTDGTPLDAQLSTTRTVAEGDVQRDPDRQAPAPPPSLRKPGETLPADQQNADNQQQSGGQKNVGIMQPVQFPPKSKPDPQPNPQLGANPDGEPDAQPAASAPSGQAATATAGSGAAAAQPTAAKPQTPPPTQSLPD